MLDEIRQALLGWFEKNGRTFVWREHPDPFTVLMAEILLKKTSAEAVNRFLPYFLESYSSIAELYETPETELARMLGPLGLSSQRAKQMKGLARVLVQSYDSKIPCSRDELLKLPGIGEYTARALLSFSFGKPEAIVDTNVARVIMRVWGVKPSRCEARRSPEVWDKASQLVNARPKRAARINWALLDLGALICKPRRPKCDECPMNGNCTFIARKFTV
ncbi:MAG TPA: hypothetical protein DCY61_01010 [Dehalococcoidia bacterium]|nr:hypothetical protein [Dehalococcoidia bacterium]